METMKHDTELSLALTQFAKLIYVDFGINKLNDRIKNWYHLTWDEFKQELENHSVKFNECLMQDWKDFFHHHKAKVHSMLE